MRELVRAAALTPLPRAPDVIEGLLNLRGALLPVLSLRRRFRLPERALHPADHFVVVKAGARDVALHVDRAEDFIHVPGEMLDDSPVRLPGVGLVAGALKLPGELVLLADLGAFLSEAEGLELDEALRDEGLAEP